ncbi:MAG TPA: xanthine dehydrogenase family protein subunit M [Blastocatellia bacterium]|jgi:CO/xanthine dehydrogenase FAD-binding subunit|nr:xanthine dehydrogenase family protein subunit M [Blastocatellia bacterium]
MFYDPAVVTPATIDEAYKLLAERGRRAKIIAGGTDLMVALNAGSLDAEEFIDIWCLNELRGIYDEGETIRIGALTTYTQLIKSHLIQLTVPALAEASRTIGAIQIQNRGTIGGNIVNASPAGDSLPVLAAFDAELEIGSARGVRRIEFNRFYTGYRQTVMAPDEMLLAVKLPKLKPNERSFFLKVGTRRAQAISKIVMGVRVGTTGAVIDTISVALGSVAPTVIRARQTESLLTNAILDATIIERAKRTISEEIVPITDLRSTEHYRRTVAGNALAKILRRQNSILCE